MAARLASYEGLAQCLGLPNLACKIVANAPHRDRYIGSHGCEDNDCHPYIQRSCNIDAGSGNVKEGGPNVENDCGQDVLDG